MSIFKDFELEVVDILTSNVLSQELRSKLDSEAVLVDLSFSGCGYFLTVKHDELPSERVVCSGTPVSEVDGILVDFVIFIEDQELMLECYSFGDDDFPEYYRELGISVDSGSAILNDNSGVVADKKQNGSTIWNWLKRCLGL